MQNFQQKFKEFILNDIFWFNKSELNFGIYKIFRQKENLIREKLDDIVANIENELSSSSKSKLDDLREKLYEVCVHKSKPLETIEQIQKAIEDYCQDDKDELLTILNDAQTEKKYDSTKVYEYLYQFFNLYYEKGDFGYTPRSFRTYSIPYVYEEYLNDPVSKNACETSHAIDYRGEETLFTWKTKDSYYIKSNKFLNSVTLNLEYKEQNYTINTNIIEKDKDKDDKKVKQYRLVFIKKEGDNITLNFNISDYATPKHTIYLAMLSVIEEDIESLNYNTIFADKKLREYFEELPFKEKTIQTSLLDENQQKLQSRFKELIEEENIKKYLFDKNKNIFKSELSGDEDGKQIKSKISKLMLNKKEYASKIYTKTKAKEFLGLDKKEKFELDNKDDLAKLYAKDSLLNFFYRLDRGINLFYAGVDSDYFIHKNLKRFLSVELDKFIKNYIFADTDAILLMDESAKKIATFARIFKEQANIFIELLSSIEEFQKYIWEKRKMVKSSHYIISSNKIEDASLLEVVLSNGEQIREWEELGIIKKNEKPNIIELQSYSYPVDTKHFGNLFKYQLLSQFENIEAETSGLLIKSENYQALRFLEPKYTDKKGDGKIKCVYIDPPYNTRNDGFVYKDNFKSASWLSMMQDRLEVAKKLIRDDGVIFSSIDDGEEHKLKYVLNEIFNEQNFVAKFIWEKTFRPSNYGNSVRKNTEYILSFSKTKDIKLNGSFEDTKGDFSLTKKEHTEHILSFPANYVHAFFPDGHYKKGDYNNGYELLDDITVKNGKITNQFKLKISMSIWNQKYLDDEIEKGVYLAIKNENSMVMYARKIYKQSELNPKTLISNELVGDVLEANKEISNLFNSPVFEYPKPSSLPKYISKIGSNKNDIILDFFGGSGTTAHAVINLNKEDDGNRKFTLIEMNDYFDSIILPRVKKVSFASEWKNGEAQNKDGYSGIFQYIELEQYDDIIDNLEVVDGVDYSKIDCGYIYEPDKNQINFRMEKELKEPLSKDVKFDIFTSLLFHEGLELINVELDEAVLVAEVKDRYSKECIVVLGSDKAEVEQKVNALKEEKNCKIYCNHNVTGVELILAETFKGK